MSEHRRDQPTQPGPTADYGRLPAPGQYENRTVTGQSHNIRPDWQGVENSVTSPTFSATPPFLPRSAEKPKSEKKPRRKVRVFTWIIVGVNALFVLGMILAVTGGGDAAEQTCAGQTFSEFYTKQDCLDAANAGAAIGSGLLVFALLVVWALVDVILGVLWMVTRKRTA